MVQFSNSKLDKFQKADLKDMKAEFAIAGGSLFHGEGFTMAVQPAFPGSKMSQVSVSFASEMEVKLRRKVGEYHALNKWLYGEYVQIPNQYIDVFFAALANH